MSATEARHFVAATQAGGVVFSTDGGLTWSFSEGAPPASDPGPGGVFNYRQILCSDRVTGDFHLYARKTGQLYRSRDGGRSFSAAAKLCASSGSVIYLRATPDHAGHLWLADGKSLHRSIDGGETWRRIDSDERRATSDAQRAGNVPQALTADRAVFGRVFIGTNGSGVWYGEAAPTRDNPADSVR